MMSLERYICRVTIVLADLKTYLGSFFFLGPPLVLRNNCRRYNISHVIYINIYYLVTKISSEFRSLGSDLSNNF